ncbi:MAG: histidine kinase [Actinomycetota bacterium]|nr:histidine kinase [Actinomycetota bacterium]
MASVALAAPDASEVARGPKASTIWALALAGFAVAAAALAFALTNEAIGADLGEPLVIALLANWITLSFVLCGLVAWSRRPESRFGPLMIVAGFVNFLVTLSWTTSDLPYTIGQSLDLLPPVLFLHVFLAFPSGRLEGRFERVLVATGYATAISLELVRMTLGGFGPHNLLEVAPNEGAQEAVTRVQLLAVAGFCVVGVGILVTRRRRIGQPLRGSLAVLYDAFAVALVMIALLFGSVVFDGPAVREIRWATFATLGLAPAAFLLGLLRSRLARSAVGDLFVELRTDPAPTDLRDMLARALRDPSLTLAYWLPDFGAYVDLDGTPVEVSGTDNARRMSPIDREGTHVAALLHDPALDHEPELLTAVIAAAGIALENARLHADLRARLEELRGSRARIVEAGQKERKRLERNLHDGAQQRLIALSLELGLLEERLDGEPEARARLDQARREIATSLEELRDVARGIHPAVVSGHGLEIALEQLAARASIPVRLNVAVGGRLPERIEVAAFYLVSESLTNIAKHSAATSATVNVARLDGQVVVEVVDDGVGGADADGGSGLRGLADRVEALEGRLRVWSPSGGGTKVQAEIPCTS